MVVAIEDWGERRKFRFGLAADGNRVARAANRYRNLECSTSSPDIGLQVPARLADQLGYACDEVVRKMVRQYQALTAEDRTTGVLIGDINGATFAVDEWEATIYVEGHSSITKEPFVGADIGVVVDIRNSSGRVVKGLLIQAKRPEEVPDDLNTISDLSDQVEKMLRRTRESYVFVYEPNDVKAYRASDLTTPLTVATVMTDAFKCQRGDRNPVVIAEALDKHLVIDIAITGPNTVSIFAPGPLN